MCTGRRIPKISLGIRGLSKNLGRDDGIEEPYWGPFLLFDILVFFGRLLSWASSETTELSKAYYLLNLGWVVVSIFYFNEEGCLNLILILTTFRDFRDSQHKSQVYEICKGK